MAYMKLAMMMIEELDLVLTNEWIAYADNLGFTLGHGVEVGVERAGDDLLYRLETPDYSGHYPGLNALVIELDRRGYPIRKVG